MVAAILAAGWLAALVVYATAEPVEENPDLVDLEQSKRYVRQLEIIGGKAAVLGSELTEWLEGLWHGRRLAYTIAVLTAAAAGGYALWDRARERPGPSADSPR